MVVLVFNAGHSVAKPKGRLSLPAGSGKLPGKIDPHC
jgi:hypothetical protein